MISQNNTRAFYGKATAVCAALAAVLLLVAGVIVAARASTISEAKLATARESVVTPSVSSGSTASLIVFDINPNGVCPLAVNIHPTTANLDYRHCEIGRAGLLVFYKATFGMDEQDHKALKESTRVGYLGGNNRGFWLDVSYKEDLLCLDQVVDRILQDERYPGQPTRAFSRGCALAGITV